MEADGVPALPISKMWGIFSSPCEGVAWDSSRHCWIAQPADGSGASAPDSFAPTVYGMEGAKQEAIKRRKAMEAHSGASSAPARCAPPAAPAGRPAVREELVRDRPYSVGPPSQVAVQRDTSPAEPRTAPAASASSVVRRRSGSPSAEAGGGGARPSQLRASSGSPTRLGSVNAAAPANPRGTVSARLGQGCASPLSRETSPPRGARMPAATPAGVRPGEQRVTRPKERAKKAPGAARGEGVRGIPHGGSSDEGVRGVPHGGSTDEVLLNQFAKLQRKVDEMQEEAKRERLEKKALRQDNERLQRAVHELNSQLAAHAVAASIVDEVAPPELELADPAPPDFKAQQDNGVAEGAGASLPPQQAAAAQPPTARPAVAAAAAEAEVYKHPSGSHSYGGYHSPPLVVSSRSSGPHSGRSGSPSCRSQSFPPGYGPAVAPQQPPTPPTQPPAAVPVGGAEPPLLQRQFIGRAGGTEPAPLQREVMGRAGQRLGSAGRGVRIGPPGRVLLQVPDAR